MKFLEVLAFPWMLTDTNGSVVASGSGSIMGHTFQNTNVDDEFLRTIKVQGWITSKSGHVHYARKISIKSVEGNVSGNLILPYMRVKGSSRVNDRSSKPSVTFLKEDVERHVDAVISEISRTVASVEKVSRQNVHEIVTINTAIYHAAEELRRAVSHPRVESIIALSQMLKFRVHFINFLNDDSLALANVGVIGVYSKFDKIKRCFEGQANNDNVSISITGQSRSVTFGPKNLVDIAAFLLIENAMKYSPIGGRVEIVFNEPLGEGFICVSVKSVGPRIKEDEFVSIFDRGSRGQSAVECGVSGTGIGLYGLKKIVKSHFNGDVSVSCGKFVRNIGDVDYHEVEFLLKFPVAHQNRIANDTITASA